MRKFVESFIDDVKVIAIFLLLFAAVYCGKKIISTIDFSSEESVEMVSEEDLFMQKCMKKMKQGKSWPIYHYGICKKRQEEKNK